MKRTTIMLPDNLAELVDRERRRRDISAAAVIRAAVEAYFVPPVKPRQFGFIGIAHGTGEAIGRNAEEILAREWAGWIERDSGLAPREQSRNQEPANNGEPVDEAQSA